MSLFIGLVAVFLLIRFLPVFLRARELLARRFPRPHKRVVDEREVSSELVELLRAADSWAHALGFSQSGWVEVERDPERVRPVEHQRLLTSFDGGTWLWIRADPQPAPGRVLKVMLVTSLLDGKMLVSSSGGAGDAYLGSADTLFHDPGLARHADTVRAHAELLAGTLVGARMESAEEHVARYLREQTRAYTQGVERGVLVARDDGAAFELRVQAAGRIAARQIAALGREIQLQRRRAAECEDRTLSPLLSEEVASYEGFEARRQNPSRRFAGPWVLVFSGLLFVISFMGFMEPTAVLLLAGAVLFHELGHFLAMRVFGYADTRIFFIPFFGGAASGHKPDAALWQEMIVLLAGPVPGIAVGVAVIAIWPQALGHEVGSIAIAVLIVVNAFNLLPVFPLDGGRIVHRLLVRGHPTGEAAVRVIASVVFVAAAIAISEPFLGALALMTLVGTGHAMRVARVERALRAARASAEPSAVLAELARHQPPLPFVTRMAMAFELRGRLAAPDASLLVRLVWLGVYLAVIAACVIAPVLAFALGLYAGGPLGAFTG